MQLRSINDSDAEKLRLANRTVNLPEGVRRSARVLLALRESGSIIAVSRSLFVARSTIRSTLARFNAGGVPAILSHRSRPGRPPHSAEMRQRVLALAKANPGMKLADVAAHLRVSVGFVCGLIRRQRRLQVASANPAIATVDPKRVDLTAADLAQLADVKRRFTLPECVRRTARILLRMNQVDEVDLTAAELDINRRTVRKTVRRFEAGGLGAVLEYEFTPGRPPLPPERRQAIATLAHQQPSLTYRAIAEEVGVALGTVWNVLVGSTQQTSAVN